MMSIIDSQEPAYRMEHEINEQSRIIKTQRDQIEEMCDENNELVDEINALNAKVDQLTAEKNALEAELRMARGEVKTVLNNIESGRVAVKRQRAELDERKRKLDERDAMTLEQMENARIAELEEKCERLVTQRDELKSEVKRLNDIVTNIRTLSYGSRAYKLVEVDE